MCRVETGEKTGNMFPFLEYCNDINLHKSASSFIRNLWSSDRNISAVLMVYFDIKIVWRKNVLGEKGKN